MKKMIALGLTLALSLLLVDASHAEDRSSPTVSVVTGATYTMTFRPNSADYEQFDADVIFGEDGTLTITETSGSTVGFYVAAENNCVGAFLRDGIIYLFYGYATAMREPIPGKGFALIFGVGQMLDSSGGLSRVKLFGFTLAVAR